MSMTKNTLHPLHISTFYTEFLSQNGIPIPQDAAIKFCAEVRTALSRPTLLVSDRFGLTNDQ